MTVKFQLLSTTAVPPTKGTQNSAGWDLYADGDFIIYPRESCIISTGIAMEIPYGWFGLLTHRSSIAFKYDGIASLGIIDSDYRGEIKVKIFNESLSNPIRIKRGDRIAQIVFMEFCNISQLTLTEKLSESKRTGGMGSTGT